jgi:hypothetical protein
MMTNVVAPGCLGARSSPRASALLDPHSARIAGRPHPAVRHRPLPPPAISLHRFVPSRDRKVPGRLFGRVVQAYSEICLQHSLELEKPRNSNLFEVRNVEESAERVSSLPPSRQLPGLRRRFRAADLPAAAAAPGKCGQAELPWQQPNAIEVQSGCSAMYYCIHGGTVSCNSPLAGTCISSGAGCGMVSCNGTATWCPGRCIGSHHCASFCGWDKPDSYCDDFGCCVCVG